jgi:hypothetical protein
VKNPDFNSGRAEIAGELGEDLSQQALQPSDEATEVVAGSGEDGIDGVALAVPEKVAAHSMLRFEMADDGFDGRAPAEFALDLWGYPPLLA